jgi:hypothetical protein
VSDGPTIADDDLPARHHPIEYLPWLNIRAEVELFQLRPGQAYRLAEWAGGEVAVENGEHVVLIPGPPALTARLGDWVGTDGERHWIEPADGFNTRYWPVGRDPGWAHTCRQPWEQT